MLNFENFEKHLTLSVQRKPFCPQPETWFSGDSTLWIWIRRTCKTNKGKEFFEQFLRGVQKIIFRLIWANCHIKLDHAMEINTIRIEYKTIERQRQH